MWATAVGRFEISHGLQQSQILLLVQHQDGTNPGRRCNQAALSLVHLWTAFTWEPLCYHAPHELWNIAEGPQELFSFTLNFYLYLPKENKQIKLCQIAIDTVLLLIYCLCVCLSWSFVLTRCCVLTWVTNILMWAILNVHVGLRLPTAGVGKRYRLANLSCWGILVMRPKHCIKDSSIKGFHELCRCAFFSDVSRRRLFRKSHLCRFYLTQILSDISRDSWPCVRIGRKNRMNSFPTDGWVFVALSCHRLPTSVCIYSYFQSHASSFLSQFCSCQQCVSYTPGCTKLFQGCISLWWGVPDVCSSRTVILSHI